MDRMTPTAQTDAVGFHERRCRMNERRVRRLRDGTEVTVHGNAGLRKICGCARSKWPKCSHGWHFNYKPRGGKSWRLSLDREVGHHVDSKSDARTEANKIRSAIDAGTFRQG